jgi:hypothetical protein
MRWIMLVASMFGFGLVFAAKSPGLLGLGLLIGFTCLFISLFGFAAERIASTSRPEVAMLTDKEITALQQSVRKPAPPSQALASSGDAGSHNS